MKIFPASLLAALALGLFSPAHAQPNTQNTPPMAQGAQPKAPDWGKMTPEERRKVVRKTTEDTLRGSLTHLGYAEKPMQDDVVKTALAEEDALEPVRAAHRKLTLALLMNPTGEKETTALMMDLRDSITEAKTERTRLIKGLEERLEFSKKPRLEAFLSIVGITGDESAFMGGITGNFTGAMANLGRQLG